MAEFGGEGHSFRIVRVSLCDTYYTIACDQVVSVVSLSAGVYLLACGLRQALLKRPQTVIRSTKRPPRANLLQMWGVVAASRFERGC